jgi:hypothetical protein
MSDPMRAVQLKTESGVSLVIALLALLIVTTLTLGMIFATQGEIWTSQNYRKLTQARYAAEAGAQWAANWLTNNYQPPSGGYVSGYVTTTFPATYHAAPIVMASSSSSIGTNYSDSAMATSFSNAATTASSNFAAATGIPGAYFQVAAQLISVQATSTYPLARWKIISQGGGGGVTAATTQVTVVGANSGTPMFPYALYATGTGCGAIQMSNNATTNSYNSSISSNPSAFLATGGNIGTNGNLSLVGGSTVHGNVSTGYAGTSTSSSCTGAPAGINLNNGGSFTGSHTVATVNFPTTNPPTTAPVGPCTASPACQSQYYAGTYNMPAGPYGDVSFGNGDTVQLAAGVYVLNSISVAGGVTVKMPSSGAVTIYIQGTGSSTPIDFSNGTIANGGGAPANLQVIYGGTGAVKLGGGTAQYAMIYAPNAAVTMNNANTLYGGIIGNTIVFAGGGTVHYDQALSNVMTGSKQLKQEGFSWNSF